ncbi:hypothetical protein CspeluHIS016_0406120 [Cutaneotrichosporon spelunceum]|uniref:Uncharacterized protein n=1 Tax=Cutaneotrichosporon spelunceum TaxID=1672016 RepID=A0AAD3TVQ4_9TREE|nr:hypothetical protein CspeluHIS016_0406120 [Cutaneotrichosporon spelunceum]
MSFETEPLLGWRYAPLVSETDLVERRGSTASTASTASAASTSSRIWGWRADDPATPPPAEPRHEAVGPTTVPKKPRGLAALLKRFNERERERKRHEREWTRPPIFGTAYGFC